MAATSCETLRARLTQRRVRVLRHAPICSTGPVTGGRRVGSRRARLHIGRRPKSRREADDVFQPTTATVGPWDQGLQHGGPPAALLAHETLRAGARDDVRLAHFSLDFFGPVPLAPMTVRAEVVRPGKRIELVTATAS